MQADSKQVKLLRTQALVLQRLLSGPATAGDLATVAYGESDIDAQRAIYVVICRLRKRGIAILLEQRSRLHPRFYRLADGTTCPYCAGTGVLKTTLGEV